MHISKPLAVLTLATAIFFAACGSSSTGSSSGSSSQGSASSSSSTSSTGSQGSASSGSSQGATLVSTRCTVCHSMDRIKSAKKTPAEWTATVQRMVRNGAQLTQQEQDIVVQYLSETYK